jgi:NAD(P)-dependent dehydrogenase (short-subunit alcohol dehydrogenase family)
VEKALMEYNGLDVLIPCAGNLGFGSVTELEREKWEYTIATNLNSVFYLCNIGLPEIIKRGGGSIIVISSIAAYKNFPKHPAYCASKAGVVAFVKQLALEYGPEIRANIICPGQVDTPLLWDSTDAFDNPQEIVEETARNMPLKRIGKPIDIAKAAAFLASDEADWITGSSLVVDGGSLLL